MEKVKAGLRGLSAAEKIARGDAVLTSLRDNPYFLYPAPSLNDLEQAIVELKQACVDALDRGLLACARKRSAVAKFDMLLSALASYVNGVSMGNEQMLFSSGLPLAKQPTPITTMRSPDGLSFKRSQFTDKWDVRWDSVPGAVVYELECNYNHEGPQQWQRAALTTRPTARVKIDRNGPQPSFRVRAIGTKAETVSDVKMAEAA